MMKHSSSVLIVLLLAVLPAAAWNSLGHRAVAEIAWRQMKPAQRQAISTVLKQHPHYKLFLTADVPAGVDTNEWAFLTGAIWPDLLRTTNAPSITQYAIHPHGIELPAIRAGEGDPALLKGFTVPTPNGQTGLSNALVALKNPHAPARERAINLCWVLHLLGDLHQPLHTTTIVTPDKPRGTGLGGGFAVTDENNNPTRLHTYWDMLPGSDQSYQSITALADQLSRAPELAPARLPEYAAHKTVASWVLESHEIAKNFAYAADRVQYADWKAFSAGKLPASAVPKLKPDYVSEAHTVAQRRLALAGQRLADVLQQVW